MLWNDIPDLDNIKNHLADIYLLNQLPHALLFNEKKSNCALALALGLMQFMNCDHPNKKNIPCGECRSCKQTKNLFYPGFQFVLPKFSTSSKNENNNETDLIKIFYDLFKENIFISFEDVLKEIKSKNKQPLISVQDIHQIIENVSYTSEGSKYKIVCIWHPELMNHNAANKLLKTLEEPPEQTLFILVTDKADELLPTILSRVQTINIPPFNHAVIAKYLKEKFLINEQQANDIAEISDGNILTAIHLQQNFNSYSDLLNDFKEFVRLAIKYDIDKIEKWSKKYETEGREAFKRFLEYSLNIFHYCILQNFQLNDLIKTTPAEKDFISKFYLYINEDNVQKLYEIFNDTYHHTARNANLRIIISNLFLRANELLKKKQTA